MSSILTPDFRVDGYEDVGDGVYPVMVFNCPECEVHTYNALMFIGEPYVTYCDVCESQFIVNYSGDKKGNVSLYKLVEIDRVVTE